MKGWVGLVGWSAADSLLINRVGPMPCRRLIPDTVGHSYTDTDTDTGLYKFFVLKMRFCAGYSVHVIQGGPKKLSPYIVLFVLLQHLFRCTNNIPCELKFCCAHTEAQTKFVCQKFIWNIATESKYPQHHYVTMAKYKSNMCACVYVSNNHFIQ